MLNKSFLLLFLFLFFSSAHIRAGGVNWKILIYGNCSADLFSADKPYKYNLDSVLTCLANSAGLSPYNNFTSSSSAYGLYQCRFDVSMSDCEACISAAISWLSCRCPNSKSAAVQLHGCLLRYGNDNFVERPGKEVMFKRCGPSGGEDVTAMKETVFDMLQSGKGLYRTGSSGYVGGSAQCVGDQSPRHCKACVKVALAQLRSTCCGASGEVYLDKCFVEYSLQGSTYYGRPLHDEHHHDHASEVGKDIAIIIGIVAAVLLIILFLINYPKKSADEKDPVERSEKFRSYFFGAWIFNGKGWDLSLKK